MSIRNAGLYNRYKSRQLRSLTIPDFPACFRVCQEVIDTCGEAFRFSILVNMNQMRLFFIGRVLMRFPDCNEQFDFSNSQVLLPKAQQPYKYYHFNRNSTCFTPLQIENPISNNADSNQFEFVAIQVIKYDMSLEYQCEKTFASFFRVWRELHAVRRQQLLNQYFIPLFSSP